MRYNEALMKETIGKNWLCGDSEQSLRFHAIKIHLNLHQPDTWMNTRTLRSHYRILSLNDPGTKRSLFCMTSSTFKHYYSLRTSSILHSVIPQTGKDRKSSFLSGSQRRNCQNFRSLLLVVLVVAELLLRQLFCMHNDVAVSCVSHPLIRRKSLSGWTQHWTHACA